MNRTEDTPVDEETPPQDRGIPPVNRVRSMQSRVSAVLAIAVAAVLGGGFIAWYTYKRLPQEMPEPPAARRSAKNTDTSLPPLDRPRVVQPRTEIEEGAEASAMEQVLGPAPPEPAVEAQELRAVPDNSQLVSEECASTDSTRTENAPRSTRARSAPAFIAFDQQSRVDGLSLASSDAAIAESSRGAQLSRALISEPVPTVRAERLPDLRFLLPKGSSIDCTLQTAIDTSLPSLVTCIAASDTYSADGSVVLLERGAQLFGETRSALTDAGVRIFVVWSEVRSGSVVARLDSPATDAQGRGGISGYMDRHFWQRFGAAFLISLIDGGMEAARNSSGRNASIILNPQSNDALLTEVLRSTADIRPTVGTAHGSRVKVLIARDVDFSSVYELTYAR